MKKALLVNWKTTATGIASLLAGVALVIKIFTGEEDTTNIAVAIGLLSAGLAGLSARDADKSSQDTGIR